MKLRTKILVVVMLVAVLGGGFCAWWWLNKRNAGGGAYVTASAKKGDVVATIAATGKIEPEEVVDVGAQVAGQILRFGKDAQGKAIDYGSVVESFFFIDKFYY